jgi:hypothetical protein
VTTEEERVSKAVFDQTADFKFAAAYETYSKSFDNVDDNEVRLRLNNIISQLFNNEISYPQFYREIDRYREESQGREFRRAQIKGQRKFAYRREQQEKDRIKRHRR